MTCTLAHRENRALHLPRLNTFFFCPQIDDDNLSKLEKADILELTVNHLTKLHSPKDPVLEAKKFQAGFGQCAAEACQFIMSVPDLDSKVSQNLISHLSGLITSQPLTIQVPERPTFSPPTSPSSVVSDRHHYYSDHDRSSSDAEDSVYSGESASKRWNSRAGRLPHKTSPMSGLLTTVDKLPAAHCNAPEHLNGTTAHRSGAYFNRVPAEAKDVILQKIRQHIMDKRGNENIDVNVVAEPTERYTHRDEVYRSDYMCPYPAGVPNNETLDLRKVRSPTKPVSGASPQEKPVAYRETNQLDKTPSSENKVEVTVNLPEQCQLPMDYNNLPPKKKRKLIEYQEYKKQEEARRLAEGFYEKKRYEGPPGDEMDASKWRPW